MIFQALRQVFKGWAYVLVAVIVALVVLVFATWLPNLGLVWQITVSPSVPLIDKAEILLALVGSIGTNFTVFSALYTIAIAALFGINVAMVAYYLNLRKQSISRTGRASAATSLGGLASGFFGIGCAACGTFVLGPVLSLVGAGGLIALLPFDGQEFGLLGVGLLGFSIFFAAKKIREPLACPLEASSGAFASRRPSGLGLHPHS